MSQPRPSPRSGGSPAPEHPTPSGELADRTLRKVRRRILPLVVVLYLIAYLDRNNVGFAKAALGRDLGLDDTAYGFGAGLFFLGYVLLEVPSNAGMARFGARKWIARILLSWGILATAMTLVTGATSFAALRFLLGAAEAGFFPAVVFYLTLWFPAAQRAAALGVFVLAQPVANAFGAPVSGLLLTLDGVWGLHGWQWMFLVEGLPAIVLGILAPRLLTDRPAQATWLRPEEREWLTGVMDAELAAKRSRARRPFLAGLRDRRALVYGLLNFGMVCGVYGLGLWLPAIVGALGHFGTAGLGLVVMIPYLVAIPCVHHWSRRADRTGRYAWHATVSLVLAAAGLAGAGLTLGASPVLALVCLSAGAIGVYSAIAPFLAMPAAVFAGAAAAASLGLVNALGNLGGFVAPYVVGLLTHATGSSRLALLFLAACLACAGLLGHRYARHRPEGAPRADNPRTARRTRSCPRP
ncbi:MFS transporter [Amycolatopsis sp. NPDC059021]|uniref:MFS transporter n=1 Tax=Amycolatopsis sp. NPDC059021 TaxID=3346704 RepID=UPI00366D105C